MTDFLDFLFSATLGRNGFVLELFICELLFTVPVRCRSRAYIRLPLSAAAYFAFGYFCPAIRLPYFTAILICLLIFALSIALQVFCFDLPFRRIVFNSSAAYILQNLTLNVKELFTIVFGWGGVARFVGSTLITLAVFVAGYFLFARRSRGRETKVHAWWIIVISLFAIIICNMLFSFINMEGLGGSVFMKMVFIICCTLAMLFQFSVFRSEELNYEKLIMEQLLANEQKQHKMSQENIDLINIKCHDLKKQIELLRAGVGRADMEKEFDNVERAVLLYGDTIKTGNENLDLVLTEKQLYCAKHDIRIEVIADGAALNFMSPADVYSLFGNAMDNAVESVMKSEAPNRIINIYIKRKHDMVGVTVSNYCGEKVVFIDDFPATTKEDKNYHGFGVRSMKYVVEKYGGNIVFDVTNDIFSVNILFPLP